MVTAANKRAASLMSNPWRLARSRSASWSDTIAMSEKNRAVSVCCGVRSDPVFEPYALTSLNSCV
jgi:hypothetical protein